ncbi:MAG: DUF1295 domain-containing protein [Pseudomonadota bacterium]
MKDTTPQSILGILAALVLAGLIGWAGSQGSVTLGGLPVFGLCVVMALLIQWLVFVHAWRNRTETYFDLTGSLTYVSLALFACLVTDVTASGILIAVLIVIWATRLGSFLYARVRRDGFDRRFNRIKTNFAQFLMTWTLQGLWVTVTAGAGLAAITSAAAAPLGAWGLVGLLLWLAGFVIEVVADEQKKKFRSDPTNRDSYISSGIWAWSRHPNYFGEIVLWTGIALIAVPHLSGWQYLTLISPVFVFVLLNYISGVRMLEVRAERRWGKDPEFQAYRARTPVLVPRPPKATGAA